MTQPPTAAARRYLMAVLALAALAGCATGPTTVPATGEAGPALMSSEAGGPLMPPPPAASATATAASATAVAAVDGAASEPTTTLVLPSGAATVAKGLGGQVQDPASRALSAAAGEAWKGKIPGDLLPDDAHSDLWQRVRTGFAMVDLDNEHVRKWEQWYGSRPEYVQRMTERGGRYLFHIVVEVERRGMPMELALLPFIESAFNPQAMSVARASGMWQFMPATGKDFELRQNLFRDDRRSVLASTQAALDYLQMLHGKFGDWQLALAAYNWGQGNVQRAVDRNARAGLPTNYESLRMPDETRNYVPKLQAVKNIIARPTAYGLTLPPLENHPYFVSVPIERDIDVALAARLAGLPLEDFQQLNPQMNKPVILAAGTPQLLLPYDNANAFLRNVATHHGALATWTAWVAPRTLKPAEAAQQVGMDEADLRQINRIPPRMLVKAGSTLLVPRSANGASDVAEHVADNAVIALAPDGPALRRVSFKAGRKGDSVAAVARRYRVSATQVAGWNDVTAGARFKPGETIVVMVPPRKASSGRKVARPKAASTSTAKARKPAASAKATPKGKAGKPPVRVARQ